MVVNPDFFNKAQTDRFYWVLFLALNPGLF